VLIDADNVSADVVEQALAKVIEDHGAAHVRRAYCTAESALKNLALFKRLSIRPIVNLSTGKNSTDIALAVDAIDLVIAERPDTVVVVSSDSDFAPLVIRLREKGCRVEGIGQAGKTGDDSVGVYDRFVDLEHRKVRAAPRSPVRRAAKAVPPLPPPATSPAPALPDDVQGILNAVPALQSGNKLELGIAAERLRAAGLLSNRAPSTKLFKKHPDFFVLTPDRQPNKVQFLMPRA
jgi:hypothetical protein